MPLTLWFAALALASAVPLGWWAVSTTRVPTGRARSNLSAGLETVTDMRTAVLQQSAHDRVVRPAFDTMARLGRRITPSGMAETLERRLALAGISDAWPLERVLAVKLISASVCFLFGLLVVIAKPSAASLLLFVILTAIGFLGPDVLINRRAEARQREIERSLADALDQITVCVESGLSFEAAVARIADGKGPLAHELVHLLQDIQIGMPRSQALSNLLARTDVPDVRAFVNAFNHAERYGIPIAQVLRAQSNELREKRRQRAEERAMKIPVKLTFPLVLCILPALFIVVAGPAVIRISHAFGI
jgi:tight adherence protein C